MKKIGVFIAGLAIVSLVILLVSSLLGKTDLPGTAPAPAEGGASTTASSDTPVQPDETVTLEPFENMDISLMGTSIRLEVGDTYSLQYHLHDKEKIDQLEVSENTLFVSTSKNVTGKPGKGPWELVVTVPKEAAVKHLNLYTAAGAITINGLTCSGGHLETNGGLMTLDQVQAQELDLEAIAKDITITNSSIQELDAENVSGGIIVSGTFNEIDLSTVSGDITVTAPAESIEAESLGGITLNGADQGKKIEQPGSAPEMELESTSGKIAITTK